MPCGFVALEGAELLESMGWGVACGDGCWGGIQLESASVELGGGGVRQVLAGLGAGVVGPDLPARVTHREAKPPLTLRLSL